MWYDHILPSHRLSEVSYGSLVLLITWPYHRTLRHFTLDPAERLSEDFHSNTPDLTRSIIQWRIAKDGEFEFVCRASTVAAAANIGIFSWVDMAGTYWLATAMFYFSLSLSLWGVVTSAQQRSVVRTLNASHYDQRQLRLKARVILRSKEGLYQSKKRRKSFAELNMLYVWQVPLMLMSYAWATLLIGLTLHVCTPLIAHAGEDKRKVAIFYLATGVACFLNFIWSSAWVCWTPKVHNDTEKATFSCTDLSAPSTRSGRTPTWCSV